jgi:hypothetical protein
MARTRSQWEKLQARNKDTATGRYRKGPECHVCHKPARHKYASHAEVDGPILRGLLLVVCDRVKCGKIAMLPAAEALATLERIDARERETGRREVFI